MSCVYYVMDGDHILASTMAGRAKAKAVGRNPKVSLCVLDENWPPKYLLVYGDAVIEEAGGDDLFIRICELMAEQPMPESGRQDLIRLAREVRPRRRPFQAICHLRISTAPCLRSGRRRGADPRLRRQPAVGRGIAAALHNTPRRQP